MEPRIDLWIDSPSMSLTGHYSLLRDIKSIKLWSDASFHLWRPLGKDMFIQVAQTATFLSTIWWQATPQVCYVRDSSRVVEIRGANIQALHQLAILVGIPTCQWWPPPSSMATSTCGLYRTSVLRRRKFRSGEPRKRRAVSNKRCRRLRWTMMKIN